MNRLAVAEVVKSVKRRISQGDCPAIPAYRISTLEEVIFDLDAEIDDLQRLPQPLKGFIPQTYGDAIQAGWIKHGDCPSHEWDNRTSAENARWMLERLLTANNPGGKP